METTHLTTMFQKILLLTALATASLAASAQWTMSGTYVGNRQFTEKSSGVYELSVPGDTIFGRFLLANGDDVRYGADNTYVLGDVPYTLANEGDSLMLGSPVVNALFTLDTNAGTLTLTGDIMPLTLRGNAKGAYWNPYIMLPLDYRGNGIYSCTDLQMIARDFTICMLTAPKSMAFEDAASWLIPYRFSCVTVTDKNPLAWGVPEKMYIAPRGTSVNFYFPSQTALVDITVNLIDVTITATGKYNPPQSTLYLIGGNIARGSEEIAWTDEGCTKGIAMTRSEQGDTVSYTLDNVKILSSVSDADENNPQGQIEIVSTPGLWEQIQQGYCFCWERETRVLTLNAANICTTGLRDAGPLATPIQLPTGTYDITVKFTPTTAPTFTAVQTDTSALEGVTVDEADNKAPVEWYDLEGRKIAEPAGSGVYIRKQGSLSQKVWIMVGK